jgi:lipoate-protein ligase B
MIDWETSKNPVDFDFAVKRMQQRVADIYHKKSNQLIWLLEHPHLFTAGTSAKEEHLLQKNLLPVVKSERGGSFTYHGPGQRIIYLMLDLEKHGKDLRTFVWNLEEWVIKSLDELGIVGERCDGRVGIWIAPNNASHSNKERKIASIGLRVRHWISYYGIFINVNPKLEYFQGIVALRK